MRAASLNEVSEFVLDGTHSSPVRVDAGVPVLSAQNIRAGGLDFDTDRFTTDTEYRAFTRRVALKPNDLLLTIVGTIGRAALVTEVRPLVFQRSVAVIRPKPEVIDPRFLLHATQSHDFKDQLRRSTNQSSQAGVYLCRLKKAIIQLPPLPEQRRIATILDQADDLRAKRRAALASLDTLTQSIFVEMYSERYARSLKRYSLGEVCDIQVGYPFKSGLYNSDDHNVRLCRGANVLPGRIDWSDLRRYPAPLAKDFLEYELTADDVLVAMDRPWISEGFKVAMVRPQDAGALLVQRVARLRAKTKVTGPFVYWLLRQRTFERHCKPTETTIPHISPSEIRQFEFELPDLEALQFFTLSANAVEALRIRLTAAIEELDALFASLQHRAFRGEL